MLCCQIPYRYKQTDVQTCWIQEQTKPTDRGVSRRRRDGLGGVTEKHPPHTRHRLIHLQAFRRRPWLCALCWGRQENVRSGYQAEVRWQLRPCQDNQGLSMNKQSILSHFYIHEDGRLPQTLKVTMRDLLKDKQSGVKARFHKESRQGKINPRFFKCLSDQGKFSALQKIRIFTFRRKGLDLIYLTCTLQLSKAFFGQNVGAFPDSQLVFSRFLGQVISWKHRVFPQQSLNSFFYFAIKKPSLRR